MNNEPEVTLEPKPPVKSVVVNTQIIPLHQVSDRYGAVAVVKRSPGRPKTVSNKPTITDLEYHAEVAQQKEEYIASDCIVLANDKKLGSDDMLRLVRQEISKEQAAIAFQRKENEKRGIDTAQHSSRRIDALMRLATIELDIKKIGAETIDVYGEKFQKIFVLWIATIKEVVAETLTPEQADLFMNRLSSAMENWEEKASNEVR